MGEGGPSLLEMGPIIYACCTDDIRGKSFVLLFHICWLLFTYPANALALESFLQYARERGGREGMKCQRKHVLKVLVLYNRMFSSRCLFVLIY